MDGLQLSEQLINDISEVLGKHDSRAEDPGIGVQYLAAVTGFLVGHMDFPHDQKSDFLDQLSQFSRHVFEDVSQPEAPSSESAFGIWKPGDA